jgi:hypothetical protein
MRAKMFPLLTFVALLGAILITSSCGSSKNCPVCGTDKNGTIGLIDVMIVPEHNPNGEPGGPFNIFDISWVDPTNRLYSVSDRIGLDVPVFSTTSNIALWAIGGQNSVSEAGNNASPCWLDPVLSVPNGPAATIPPITSAQGNYTRFGCKTDGFRLPGGFGPNGLFGGFPGGQCCASRSNNLNPLSGPNGLEVSADGNFMFVGTGSASFVIFDLAPMLASGTVATGFTAPPLVTAVIPTGTSPDYDGLPNGITNCEQSANGRAFADPTCGDLRGDELATTGSVVTFPQDGSSRFLVAIINGDPGLPFVSIVDVTGVVTRTGTDAQQHCLAYSQVTNPLAQNPFSPGISTYIPGPGALPITTTFEANFDSCILGQIYYDGAPQNNNTDTIIDDIGENATAGFVCPDPSLQFASATPGMAGGPVPSGASGHAAGFNPDVACHHGPILDIHTGVYDPTCDPGVTPTVCMGAIAPAGLGGMAYYAPLNSFLITNGNSTADITVGSVDVIDPLHPVTVGGVTSFVPAIVNSYPTPMCMPTGVNVGPGTDVLVGCADHDGRAFAPSTIIINGTTGEILTTINNVGFVDETWYNPGDNNYYLAARDMPTGPVLGVISAKTRQWLQNVSTNGNAHSVAADPINNHIFVPLPSGSSANCQSASADGCVGVYAAQ